MAMVVLLLGRQASLRLGPPALAQLSRLGVTHVSILQDEQTLGVVLEGWAFQPDHSSAEAIAAMGANVPATQTLHGIAQLAVESSYRAEEEDET